MLRGPLAGLLKHQPHDMAVRLSIPKHLAHKLHGALSSSGSYSPSRKLRMTRRPFLQPVRSQLVGGRMNEPDRINR
jgi:hypothetical protein